jgi:hypothetical protein
MVEVEGDPLFRMAERFSSLKTCQGRAKRAASGSGPQGHPGQVFKDEKNGLHANNGPITNS